MSGGRGAGDVPLTYDGAYDATVTYLPRQVVTDGGGVYMALAKSTGATPASSPTSWLPLGGGGGSGLAIVGTVWPTSPATGQLFYKTDATC